MSVTDILGGLGNGFAILFFIIPLTVIIEVYKTGKTDKVPYLLFLFTILNCEFWTLYGVKENAWPLIACNVIGIITNHIFLTVYFIYLNIVTFKKILFIGLLYFTFILSFTSFYILVKDSKFFGTIAMIMNICMFVAPLQNLNKVVKLKDNSYIPIWISMTLVFNCTVWSLYGYFKDVDLYVMIPNILGLLLAVLQVVLWFKYRNLKAHSSDTEENELEDKDFPHKIV
jgi:solute carrier family 50 protein (sugar transporter)